MADRRNQVDQTTVDRLLTDDDHPATDARRSRCWTMPCWAVNRTASADSNTDTTAARGRGRTTKDTRPLVVRARRGPFRSTHA